MREKIIEIFKYGIYGILTTFINLLLFFVLENIGVHYLSANTFSYVIAVAINYVLNKKYVFKTENYSKTEGWVEFFKFLAVRMISLLIDNGLFYFVVDVLNVNVYVGRIVLSIAIIMLTFVVNKVFVFKEK